jgi:hypothetical protein
MEIKLKIEFILFYVFKICNDKLAKSFNNRAFKLIA